MGQTADYRARRPTFAARESTCFSIPGYSKNNEVIFAALVERSRRWTGSSDVMVHSNLEKGKCVTILLPYSKAH